MGLLDDISSAAGLGNSNGTRSQGESYQQYEPCKIKACKYHNAEGFCSKETCVVLNENPSTAMMVTKNCMFCGSKFTTNLDSMQIQLCPQCLAEALEATSRGDGTNALSGTVNVADEKIKSMQKTRGGAKGGLDMSCLGGDLAALNQELSYDNPGDLADGMSDSEVDDETDNTGGHSCMFCGAELIQNPSLFFPCCPECFAKLKVVTTQCSVEILETLAQCDAEHLGLAGTSSHCYACDW